VGAGLGFGIGSGVGATTSGAADDIVQSGSRFALGGLALGLLAAAVGTRGYKGDLPPSEARREGGKSIRLAMPGLRIEQSLVPEGVDRRVVVDVFKGTW